jgi:hypothetical protein
MQELAASLPNLVKGGCAVPYRTYSSSEFETLQGGDGFLGRQLTIQFPSSNWFGFPDIAPYEDDLPEQLIGYNQLARVPSQGVAAVHFYLTDNKFETVWSRPAVALTRLKEVGLAIGPDFSIFTDWNRMVQMWNYYRNLWVMALWQAEGLQVIPNVCWSTEDSYGWCFEGLPRQSVVSVSSVGTFKYPESRRLFIAGYHAMEERLEPVKVLCYGRVPKELQDRDNIREYPSKWDEYYNGSGVM